MSPSTKNTGHTAKTKRSGAQKEHLEALDPSQQNNSGPRPLTPTSKIISQSIHDSAVVGARLLCQQLICSTKSTGEALVCSGGDGRQKPRDEVHTTHGTTTYRVSTWSDSLNYKHFDLPLVVEHFPGCPFFHARGVVEVRTVPVLRCTLFTQLIARARPLRLVTFLLTTPRFPLLYTPIASTRHDRRPRCAELRPPGVRRRRRRLGILTGKAGLAALCLAASRDTGWTLEISQPSERPGGARGSIHAVRVSAPGTGRHHLLHDDGISSPAGPDDASRGPAPRDRGAGHWVAPTRWSACKQQTNLGKIKPATPWFPGTCD